MPAAADRTPAAPPAPRRARGRLRLALLLPVLLTPLTLAAQPAMDAFSLADHQWKHRVVLVFAPGERAPAYEMQLDLLRGAEEGLDARDVLVVRVLEGGGGAGERSLTRGEAQALRDTFDIDVEDFALVLVGKDGTVKRRDDAPVNVEALFDQIDGMPMRQRELREGDGERDAERGGAG